MEENPFRKYIEITESMSHTPELPLVESNIDNDVESINESIDDSMDTGWIEEEISNLIFKMNSYHDSDFGDYADGVEAGMAKAAEMLQNLLNRIRG
jgi:hypothetical protein